MKVQFQEFVTRPRANANVVTILEEGNAMNVKMDTPDFPTANVNKHR